MSAAAADNRFVAVAGAFFYLQATSLYNNLRRRLLRLRQPKYLLGALAGAAYMYAFVFRHMWQDSGSSARALQAMPPQLLQDLPALAALVLLLVLWLDWLFAGEGVALGFTETEIAFLFPAPLTRTALIQYSLLRSQLAIFFSSFLLGLLLRRGAAFGGHPLQYATGLWLLLSMGRLHLLAAAFTRQRLAQAGLRLWPRRVLVVGVGVLALACLWPLRSQLAVTIPSGAVDADSLHRGFRALVDSRPLAWLLLPLQWAVAPIFAPDSASFLRALLPAAGLLLLHYLWAVRAQVSFAEASIAQARRHALRQTARREGRLRERAPSTPRRAPFVLAATGFPALAFLWKGLLAMGPVYRLRSWLLACLLSVIALQWVAAQPWAQPVLLAVGLVVVMIGGWGLLFGPMFMQRSVQRLLEYLDILKAMPLGGRQIALGELLTPVAVMSFALWLLVWVGAWCFVLAGGKGVFTPELVVVAAMGVALLIPPLCGLMLCLPFAGTVYFPAWVAPGKGGGRGVEVMGQRMIFMAGYLLALTLALVPAALLAGLGFLLGNWLLGLPAGIGLAAACACVVLGLELNAVLTVLGRRIDAFDVSQELR
ncbi:MAG: hypothetical protein KGL91_01685 [Xanthomonadaceae bacterium]|nr:hypothetical protein [Xanthomonadaceae bacterium]